MCVRRCCANKRSEERNDSPQHGKGRPKEFERSGFAHLVFTHRKQSLGGKIRKNRNIQVFKQEKEQARKRPGRTYRGTN